LNRTVMRADHRRFSREGAIHPARAWCTREPGEARRRSKLCYTAPYEIASMIQPPESARAFFAHDGLFWRRMAALGAQRFPTWWVRYSPPVFGVAAAVALPRARRAVRSNLRRIRGPRPLWRDVIDTTQTFTAYAGCLAETLATGSKNDAPPSVVIRGREHVRAAVADGRGLILLTMHTGGWEVAGPLLAAHTQLDVVVVMEGERDADARELHDRARESSGVRLIHIGQDPLAALPLVRHLSEHKGAAAMQIDRAPTSGRVLGVRMLDRDATLPEGPFRLAQLTGAPVLPVFCERLGFRRYAFEAYGARTLPRRASAAQIAAVAQSVADDMTRFLRAHPTQWFEFG
jgi:lauroyl/myristoyl acyltransferase